MIASHICYNLNQFDKDFVNSSKFGIRTRISDDMTNLCESIYRTALTEDFPNIDIKFGNYSNFVHHFDTYIPEKTHICN